MPGPVMNPTVVEAQSQAATELPQPPGAVGQPEAQAPSLPNVEDGTVVQNLGPEAPESSQINKGVSGQIASAAGAGTQGLKKMKSDMEKVVPIGAVINHFSHDLMPDVSDVLWDVMELKRHDPCLFEASCPKPGLKSATGELKETQGKPWRSRGAMLALSEDSRTIVQCFLNRLQGRTFGQRIRVWLRCWWRKSELVKTVQYVQDMADNCRAVNYPGEFAYMEKWRLYDETEPKDLGHAPKIAGLKMYQMFILLYSIECRKWIQKAEKNPTSMVTEGAEKEIQYTHLGGRNVLTIASDCAWTMRRITKPPPESVLKNDDYRLCRQEIYVPEERLDRPDPDCPFHPDWMAPGVKRIDCMADDFFAFKTEDARKSKTAVDQAVQFAQKEVRAFGNEDNVMSIYRDFCSTTLGMLRDQLDMASMLQAKVLGLVATGLFAFLNLVFQTYVKPIVEEF